MAEIDAPVGLPESKPSSSTRGSTKATLAAIAIIAAVVAGLAVVAPSPRQLSSVQTGSAELIDRLLPHIDGEPLHNLAVAEISPDGQSTFAGRGADEHTEFEVGSITKTFTGALLAVALEEGEVTAETTVSDLFPEVTSASGSITLMELATHSSGLPRVGYESTLEQAEFLISALFNKDPYDESLEDIIEILNSTELDPEPEPAYSNLGFSVLGLALAQAAGSDYESLLQARLFTPLGMDETRLVWDSDDLNADSPSGYSAQGDKVQPWSMEASSPAGGIRSTAHDLAIWAQEMSNRTAPGAKSMDPVADYTNGRKIGMAWITNPPKSRGDQSLISHNGGTSGFSSYMGIAEDGHVIIVLGDTETSVDGVGAIVRGPIGVSQQ